VLRLSGVEPVKERTERPCDDPCDFPYPEWVALELAVNEQAPRQARAEVREALAGRVSQSESEVAVLITSELVTNAVVHPVHRDGASIRLCIGADERRVRVEVTDSGRGFEPAELTPNDNASGGRGLVVVDRGATRWGTSNHDGFSVWFELASASGIAQRMDAAPTPAQETGDGAEKNRVLLDHRAAV
jgi:anti-sigma regulatory factor (Ser/Thr protein kinase)